MKMGKVLPITLGIVTLAFAGCGGDSGDGNGSGGSGNGGGGSGGSGSNVCNTDTSRLSSSAAVSFRAEVMPIFGQSCVQSQCHDKDAPMAGMYLGPKCTFNLQTSACEFTATTPLTDADVAEVIADIVDVASQTVPTVKRVAPGDPANSFLLQKTADTHLDQGYTCTRQSTVPMDDCGDEMPPGSTLCTQNNGQARWDKIAAWILQGAQNN